MPLGRRGPNAYTWLGGAVLILIGGIFLLRNAGVIDAMEQLPPSGSAQVYRRAVALTLVERRRATLESLNTRGVIPIDVPADRLTPEVINAYLDLKARGRV